MKEDINVTRFTNGLAVLSDRMLGVRSVTLGFFYRTGARHEPAELNGISHFIEHTVFKGTKNRSALEIAVEQDRLGGTLEAFTTHEETGFAIKVIDDQLESAFELLADMLGNPMFDENELKSERRVIIEEMKMIEDSPEEYLGDIFHEKLFPKQSLGRSIAGTPKTVKTFSHHITRGYHRRKFSSNNLVIVAAGNVQHERLVELAERLLVKSSSRAVRVPSSSTDRRRNRRQNGGNPVIAAPIVVKQNANLEQAHLILATPFISAADKRRYAADLLANILGGGTSSRLWQKVREERGLAYNVGASTVMFQDCGFFTIFAGTSPRQTEEVLDIAIDEMRAVVKDGVTEEELELAKHQAVATILLSLEDSAVRAATLAQSEMVHGRQIPIEETLAKIAAVTLNDLQAIAKEFFRTERVAFAALGDLNGFKIKRNRLVIS
jgi:predicted Zn-dependent peptidase